jgi:DNA polymerase-3 subunit beta
VELTISIRDLKRLVTPVIPCAGTDDTIPVLTAVKIESRGKYLTAVATDRFRMAMQRVAAPEDGTWPEWSALVPVSALKSILATFKPSYRDANPVLTLKVDGEQMRAESEGALLDLFSEAHVAYRLMDGEFPKVRGLLLKAIKGESTSSAVGLNPALLGGVLPKPQSGTVMVKIGEGGREPIVFTDGEDFVSILIPRKAINASGERDETTVFPSLDDWTELLADPAPPVAPEVKPAAKKRTRKGAAA